VAIAEGLHRLRLAPHLLGSGDGRVVPLDRPVRDFGLDGAERRRGDPDRDDGAYRPRPLSIVEQLHRPTFRSDPIRAAAKATHAGNSRREPVDRPETAMKTSSVR